MGLARHLPKDRFSLTVCSLRSDGVAESRPQLAEYGAEVFVARFRPRGGSFRRLIEMLKDSHILRARGPFDLQHSMDFTSSPFEALMSRRHARKFMFTQRNMNESGFKAALGLKARLSCRVVCVSEAARCLLVDQGAGSRALTIYPGIDVDGIPWRPPANREGKSFQLLMVAHIARRKGIETALAALRQVTTHSSGVQLCIAGRVDDPAYQRELNKLVEKLGVKGSVRFLGPRSDVFKLMQDADALLHTAESEAFGLALIEAMAVGLPVIAPRMQGPAEIIMQDVSGILVSPGDAHGFSCAIRTLSSNLALATSLSVQGRKRVADRFAAQRMAEDIAGVYEAACT